MRLVPVALAVLMVGCARADGVDGGSPALGRDLAASMEVRVGGEAVHLAFHVTNDGTGPVSFRFPSSQRYDFRVETMAGETVWRWSEGMAFAQVVTSARLEPGETWGFEAEWSSGERRGRYVAVGWLTTSDGAVEQRMTFDLP